MTKQASFFSSRTFFLSTKAGMLAGAAVAALVISSLSAGAQMTGSTTTTTDAKGQTQQSSTITFDTSKKKKKPKVAKEDRVQQSKDTKAANKKESKYNPLVGKDASLPDKTLYDKALDQAKRGHFDVARLDLNTLLSTYPDSQYQMRAKLAVADSWFREGGSAALAQAEQEYSDFITFFPNSPEASEAQMRIGDIYMKQMDVPDRDYTKAMKAQDAYRTMLKQYPDAPKKVNDEAKQKLREVQEVLATREADLGAFYASRENWPATIARYQTVADLYPLYSHTDDVLIAIGDAYEAEARTVRAQNLPEGPKAKLEQEYDGKAASYYREVVLNHAAAPHVEDAKERLAGMNLPIPTPTPEQVAASEAIEGSREQESLKSRLQLLVMRKPNTVSVARIGDPALEDKPVTTAPTVVNQIMADYRGAFSNGHPVAPAANANEPVADSQPETPASPGVPATPAAPLALQDVPSAGNGSSDASVGTVSSAPASGGRTTGTSVGVEVLTPGINTGSGAASSLPSATGAPDPNLGLTSVGKDKVGALPSAEAPAEAPDQVNDAAGKATPAAETKDPNKKKNPKPDFDKDDESSSKHKKKKGVDKINPF